ncbi:MAG: lysophospholipid acyltransferase family protein [Alphaproteobacteria bacterium]
MITLRSLAFNFLFILWSMAIHIVCLPVLLLPRGATIWAGRIWAGVSLGLLATICGLRHEIRGRSNLPDGPFIIAAKHQSAWDTLIFPLLVDGPAFVFKRELMWIPLLGWYMVRAGCIPIDRRAGPKALRRLIVRAKQTLARGQNIVIFPEGTRVAPGAQRPYLPGVAALYSQLNVPVVPVAVNSGQFWGRRSFRKRPGRIVLEFLPPIAPGLPRRDFAAELQQRIENASNALLIEARHDCG